MGHVWLSHISHMNESCHVWMSHVTYEWVMSRMNELCHIWMSHMSSMNESCHVWMSHVTYECVISHVCISHVTSALARMSQVTYINTSCLTYTHEWVMFYVVSYHTWMRHVTYAWVMSHLNQSCHIWMSHFTYEWVTSRMNESRHVWLSQDTYGVVLVSRIDKIIGLFCKRDL